MLQTIPGKGTNCMEQIINQAPTKHNSYPSVVRIPTTKFIPKQEYDRLKHAQHKHAEETATLLRLRAFDTLLLHELINCSDKQGISRVSQQTLATRLRCSESTIKRRIAFLKGLDVIATKKNGWQQSNTIVLLFVQHLLNHKEVTLTYNLTPLDCASKAGNLRGMKDKKKEACAALEGRASPPDPIWDDHIDANETPMTTTRFSELITHAREMLKC